MNIVKYDQVTNKIIQVRNQNVIIDTDVAELYGVETKHVNQAVKNNPERFPTDFIIELTRQEKTEVVKNFDHLQSLKFSKVNPKAFTEQGLYMLATVLRSSKATETTIAIIKTFAQIKKLTQAVHQFSKATSNEQKVKIFEDGADIITDLLDNELIVSQKETEIKFKLPFLEITKKIIKVKK